MVIETVTNEEDGVSATVFVADSGQLCVHFSDDDSGETVAVIRGFASVADAQSDAFNLVMGYPR